MILKGTTLGALLALAAAAAACGGVTNTGSGGSDASTDRTLPGHDAAADVTTPVDTGRCDFCDAGHETSSPLPPCPSAPPTVGEGCPDEGEQCEYGPHWWLVCNDVYRCSMGSWQKVTLGYPGPCTELTGDTGACPATWAEAHAIDAGLICPAGECQYPEGNCACLDGCGGGGRGRPPGIMGRWYCTPATAQCPSPRPLLGTTCDESDASFCTYGGYCGCGQQLECKGGVWQGEPIPPCP